ncbi:glycosyltransferase family 2 protein [Streptosporangium saharense]|uniref:Glycosyltransferase 2-like domain-containing protein n=1 Tax=Streptosporangium saharense TaxID=1706840 RepID=A0A7W7QJ68_9ACTN|nr:glycosyltransferase [Streptosporangium saharense]MBB4914522.1 hypothetical protein [Streptosporangium saharense]
MPSPPPLSSPVLSVTSALSATPAGFLRAAEEGMAELAWSGSEWLAGEPVGGRPEAGRVAALRPLLGLEVVWPEREVPVDALLALAAAGVPLRAAVSPAWTDPGLARLLAAWTPEEPAENPPPHSVTALRREEHSVRLRRHGLPQLGVRPLGTPAVSVVMSTMRPHLLGGALAQIAAQRRVEVEVLLGLHGVPADHPEVRHAIAASGLPVTVVEAPAATPFGEVLNLAATRASGEYVAKWDDDDWYGPEHLADLLLARAYTGADIVGTAAEFFYLEPLNVTVRRTDYTGEIWSDHVAGGTILTGRDVFTGTGGFPALPRGVDAAFLKAAHAEGARIYRTHGLGYVLRRSVSAEHTWRLPLAHFLRVATNQWCGFRPSLLLEAS